MTDKQCLRLCYWSIALSLFAMVSTARQGLIVFYLIYNVIYLANVFLAVGFYERINGVKQ